MLAVVRCGDKSLHESWSLQSPHFNVALSYFGDATEPPFQPCRFLHRYKGGKWDGIYAFFASHPEVINEYDLFWFPDDDIKADGHTVERLVQYAARYCLDLCQPSLDENSYFSHLITLQHPSFDVRFTNFVEIMAPLVSRDLLKIILPTMAVTRSGFGLDFAWTRSAWELPNRQTTNTAIIDALCVEHTRPVGGNLHSFIKKVGGRSPEEEMRTALEAIDEERGSQINGLPTPRIKVISGIRRSGETVTMSWMTAALVAKDLTMGYRNKVQPVRALPAIRHAIKTLM